jgi:hypothetical protein
MHMTKPNIRIPWIARRNGTCRRNRLIVTTTLQDIDLYVFAVTNKETYVCVRESGSGRLTEVKRACRSRT